MSLPRFLGCPKGFEREDRVKVERANTGPIQGGQVALNNALTESRISTMMVKTPRMVP